MLERAAASGLDFAAADPQTVATDAESTCTDATLM